MREKNEQSLRKQEKNDHDLRKMRRVELLPTRDCEAGYGPATGSQKVDFRIVQAFYRILRNTRTLA